MRQRRSGISRAKVVRLKVKMWSTLSRLLTDLRCTRTNNNYIIRIYTAAKTQRKLKLGVIGNAGKWKLFLRAEFKTWTQREAYRLVLRVYTSSRCTCLVQCRIIKNNNIEQHYYHQPRTVLQFENYTTVSPLDRVSCTANEYNGPNVFSVFARKQTVWKTSPFVGSYWQTGRWLFWRQRIQ